MDSVASAALVDGGKVNQKYRCSWTQKAWLLAISIVVLPAAQASAASGAPAPATEVVVAIVTLKDGMPPSRKSEYEQSLKAACGELGTAAKSRDVNAKVVGGWSGDQYSKQADPKAAGKTYGNHLTIETFKGAQRTGRWHLYESGSAWVDRKGDGKSSVESCHS